MTTINLLAQIHEVQARERDRIRQQVASEAERVAKAWAKLILNYARNGDTSTDFTEMTCLLRKTFDDATDLTTEIFLNEIGNYFRAQGLQVSKAYQISNRNGYQMRIDVSWK